MRILVLLVVCIAAGSRSLSASVIYESATFGGGSNSGGLTLSEEQYIGQRFTIPRPARLTAIGGDIAEFEFRPGGLFGVIVSLAGPNALPSGSPFDSTTIASVVLTALFHLPTSASH
jgi:hypothetical protein